jgi:hypothetical protein
MHQYINHVVCFNTRDSHHLNKRTILHVFRARRYDSIVPLSWYKQLVYKLFFKLINYIIVLLRYKRLRVNILF